MLHDDTTETRRTFFNDALLLLLLLVFLLRDFSFGDVTLCVCAFITCVCVWLKNDDSDEKQGGVAAEFFFPSFVRGKNFEKKAKKHQSIHFFRVLFFRCVKVYSQRDYLYY